MANVRTGIVNSTQRIQYIKWESTYTSGGATILDIKVQKSLLIKIPRAAFLKFPKKRSNFDLPTFSLRLHAFRSDLSQGFPKAGALLCVREQHTSSKFS